MTILVAGSQYPCGPCGLPLKCPTCSTVVTNENVEIDKCDNECEVCEYCGWEKCPNCLTHLHCGGCIWLN